MRSNSRPSCILLTGHNPYLNHCAEVFAAQRFRILAHVTACTVLDEPALAGLRPDYVFSFISNHILRGSLLQVPNVNFHPAPPEWPGKGSASFALANGDPQFGSTAHTMVAEVDAGPILRVLRFAVAAGESCESVFLRSEQGCLQLFFEILAHVASHNAIPPPCGETWKRKAKRLREFEDWLVLDPSDPDAFRRRIAATRHPTKPGPYVYLHGHRFALDEPCTPPPDERSST